MASQENEMGLVDLENFLKRTFPENKNKVNILLEQIAKSKAELEKETGEANPFFYGAISRQMRATASKGIDSWVDSKGNVNITQINAVAKIAKKELEVAKERENKEENQSKNVVEQQEEFVKQEFKKIDYENLQAKDLMFVAQNMKIFRENASMEEYKNVVETMNGVLGTPNKFSDWQELAKFQLDNPDKALDEQQNKILQAIPKELLNKDGKTLNQTKMETLDKIMGNVYRLVLNGIEIGKVPTQDEIMNLVHETKNSLGCNFKEELLEELFTVNLINELDGKSPEEQKNIINKKIEEQKERRKQENNLDKKEETPKDLEDEFFSALAEDNQEQSQVAEDTPQKTEAQMQEENEKKMNAEFEQTPDYSQSLQEESLEDDIFAALAEYDEAQMEQAVEGQEVSKEPVAVAEEQERPQAPMSEEMDVEEQDAYKEETTFEVKEGFFASILAKVKAIMPKSLQERFMPKDKTKQLSAGKAEVTKENGVVQTSYYENGSLLPANIKARNFIRNFSVKAVEAITNGIKNITERNRQEDVILNKPETIKSDNSQKQQELKDREVQLENIKGNSFDKKYSIHNQASEFYMTDEQIAVARENAMAKSSETHDKSVPTKEEKPVVKQTGGEGDAR